MHTVATYLISAVFVLLGYLFVKYMIFQYPKNKDFNKEQEERLRKFWETRNKQGYHLEDEW